MHRPCRTATVALAAITVLALAGCSDDEPGPSGTTAPTEASSASSEEPTAPASSSGTSEPTPSASEDPGVEPASGPVLEGDGLTLRAPAGWDLAEQEVSWVTLASSPDTSQTLTISSVPSASRSTLDSLEDSARATAIEPDRTRAQPRRDVAGVEAFHLVGPSITGERLDQFGALNAEQQVLIEFDTPSSMPQARRDALIDSVLASVEWK